MKSTYIVGRLVNEPEVKELDNGKKVTNVTLAVPRSYKNSNGEYETDFIKCSLWNGIAERVTEYCKKGDVISVGGHIQERKVEKEKGKYSELEFIADKISFIGNYKKKENVDEKEM